MKTKSVDPAWPATGTLPKCTEEQAKEYWRQAKAFIAATKFYSSIRGSAECAVAEYIAYQAGYTIRDWQANN